VSFISCYETNPFILMEGALGERLKREYDLQPDDVVAYANIIYRQGGKDALFELWNQYIDVAKVNHLPFIATTPTRRANRERVAKGGYDQSIILDNVSILKQLRDLTDIEMYIGGLMGCRGDAYKATESLQPTEAKEFHSWQADLFTQAGVDFLYAGIMPALPEAIGMAMAMEQTKLPYVISFMLRDNGRLLDGSTMHNAIEEIDSNVKRKPVCYMTNYCLLNNYLSLHIWVRCADIIVRSRRIKCLLVRFILCQKPAVKRVSRSGMLYGILVDPRDRFPAFDCYLFGLKAVILNYHCIFIIL
jgi:S-methylmethionine-dependent homocysteine/selenocysteine methylase